MGPFTALDIVVLLLVLGGAVLGGFRGFTTEILSLGTWVAVIFALKFAHDPATALLEGPVGTRAGAAVLAFALVGGVVYIAGKLVANWIGGGARRSLLGPVDRLLGFGFGALKGLIGATLIYLAANLGTDMIYGGQAERPHWMTDSRSYPLLNASGRAIVDFVEMRRKEATDDDPAGSGKRD